MNFLKRPFQLGKAALPSNIFYAPLAGCSDFPFRQMSALYRPGLMYCEMVKMDALIRYDQGTFQMLDYNKEMHPIGGQIVGAKPAIAGKAAKIIEELGFDVVDLNCGCPVDKVTKDGGGSGLLRNPKLIGEIIVNMVAAVKIPVTVKIRAGWDEKSIVAPEITRIAEEAGAVAICIHARTREQAYRGPANWEYVKACKEVAKTIKVIGNGDVLDGTSAQRIFTQTGCDAVLVSRGTMGHPWVVEDIIRHLEGLEPIVRTSEDARQALLEHFLKISTYANTRKAVVDTRRVGCWYLKRSQGTRSFREKISRVESLEDAEALIRNFSIELDEGDQEEDGIEQSASC